MTPKTLEQMAEEYRHEKDSYHAGDDYLAGAKAALSLPEVRALVEALEHVSGYREAILEKEFDRESLALAQMFDDVEQALAAFDRLSGEVG